MTPTLKNLTTTTEYQIAEIIKCSDPESGFLYFANNFVNVHHPVNGNISIELFDAQAELMESFHNNQFSISMLARQSGKTLCAAIYLLWAAMFKPSQEILITSNKLAMSCDVLEKMRYIYHHCPHYLTPKIIKDNKKELAFANGSNIYGSVLAEYTGKARSLDILYCDEYAFCNSVTAKKFIEGIFPCMLNTGRIIITSTPNHKTDPFMNIWNNTDKNQFVPFTASWDRFFDRSEAWKTATISRMGAEYFRKEFEIEVA